MGFKWEKIRLGPSPGRPCDSAVAGVGGAGGQEAAAAFRREQDAACGPRPHVPLPPRMSPGALDAGIPRTPKCLLRAHHSTLVFPGGVAVAPGRQAVISGDSVGSSNGHRRHNQRLVGRGQGGS